MLAKQIFVTNFFLWTNFFLVKENFGQTRFVGQHFFFAQYFFYPQRHLAKMKFWPKLWPSKFVCPNKNAAQNYFVGYNIFFANILQKKIVNFFWQFFCLGKKNVCLKIFWPKNVFCQKTFAKENFSPIFSSSFQHFFCHQIIFLPTKIVCPTLFCQNYFLANNGWMGKATFRDVPKTKM